MKRRVLLIEDEPHIAEAICFLLARDGWQVDHLASGGPALEHAQAGGPDLIVLDYMLPDMSGMDLLAQFKSNATTRQIPVLMLTAKSQDRDREAALRAGADRFMTKPFANAEMLAVARLLVGC